MVAKQKPHVFLSYVREDAERVERLAADLEARGIETWLDRHQIKPGQRWQKAIEDAIRSGAFFVACFSQSYASRTRSYVNEELLLAIAEVRLRPEDASWFIPIRLDECEIPDRRIGPELGLRSFQWLDMFPDWARSVDRLVETIAPSPRPFRDIDAPWCPELVEIPPGMFMMGGSTQEVWVGNRLAPRNLFHAGLTDPEPWEEPQHEVQIGHRLAVGRYPVTFEEYDRFATETGQEPPHDQSWGRGRRPVVNVSWDNAQAYVTWLRKTTGQPYRLLSEAEWEYACRAGTTTHYSCGDGLPTPAQANFGNNVGKTSEIGTYPPNPWGFYDMHGNVYEWVEDCWNDSYEGAPRDGSSWTSGDCSRRVIRGGSWAVMPSELRSAVRNWGRRCAGDLYIGFRVAQDASRSESLT